MYDYIIDPQGDVIIILHHPDAALYAWEPDAADNDRPTVIGIPEEGILPAAEGTRLPEETRPPEETHQPEETRPPAEDTPVTYLVSSRHLILASPMFKAALTGGWKEGKDSGGLHRLDAEEWDSEAMAIVMNTIHGRCSQVPRTVTLRMLTKIAMIVDYYQVHEPLQIIGTLWIHRLPKGLPSSLGQELILWIYVSWVFGDESTFQNTTETAIFLAREDIKAPPLPIPAAVVDRINKRREDMIESIAVGLHNLQEDYIKGRRGCSFACRSMQLGALVTQMHDHKIPHFSRDNNLSLAEILERVLTIESPEWYDAPCSAPHKRHLVPGPHQCPGTGNERTAEDEMRYDRTAKDEMRYDRTGPLGHYVRAMFGGVRAKVEGLSLADFACAHLSQGRI